MPVSILSTLDLPAASEAPLLVTLASAGNSGGRNNSDGHGDSEATGGNELFVSSLELYFTISFHYVMLIKSMTFLKAAECLFSLYNKPIIIISCHCPAHLCSPTPKSLSINSPGVSPHP